jgi:hypothetical protein
MHYSLKRHFIQKLLHYNKNCKNLVRDFTIEALKQNVVVKHFSRMTRKHINEMYKYIYKHRRQFQNVHSYINNSLDHKQKYDVVYEKIDGFITKDDTIYINNKLLGHDMLLTIVHEINHHYNQSSKRYKNKSDIIREELRAHIVEYLFEHNKSIMTRSDFRKIQNRSEYKSKMIPDGIYY